MEKRGCSPDDFPSTPPINKTTLLFFLFPLSLSPPLSSTTTTTTTTTSPLSPSPRSYTSFFVFLRIKFRLFFFLFLFLFFLPFLLFFLFPFFPFPDIPAVSFRLLHSSSASSSVVSSPSLHHLHHSLFLFVSTQPVYFTNDNDDSDDVYAAVLAARDRSKPWPSSLKSLSGILPEDNLVNPEEEKERRNMIKVGGFDENNEDVDNKKSSNCLNSGEELSTQWSKLFSSTKTKTILTFKSSSSYLSPPPPPPPPSSSSSSSSHSSPPLPKNLSSADKKYFQTLRFWQSQLFIDFDGYEKCLKPPQYISRYFVEYPRLARRRRLEQKKGGGYEEEEEWREKEREMEIQKEEDELIGKRRWAPSPRKNDDEITTRILFGSSNRQQMKNDFWPKMKDRNPNVFIWMGDNVYADYTFEMINPLYQNGFSWTNIFNAVFMRRMTTNSIPAATPQRLEEAYANQSRVEGYRNLTSLPNLHVVGTWDNHDYGIDNADKYFIHREESKQKFLDFIGELPNSERRSEKRKGIYDVRYFDFGKKEENRRVAIILLDTRFNKDPSGTVEGDILGEDQWLWLEKTLRSSTAIINLVVSSIQVLPQHRGMVAECWDNFPSSRIRLLNLLLSSNVSSPLLLSGDVHFAEYSAAVCHRSDDSSLLRDKMPNWLFSFFPEMKSEVISADASSKRQISSDEEEAEEEWKDLSSVVEEERSEDNNNRYDNRNHNSSSSSSSHHHLQPPKPKSFVSNLWNIFYFFNNKFDYMMSKIRMWRMKRIVSSRSLPDLQIPLFEITSSGLTHSIDSFPFPLPTIINYILTRWLPFNFVLKHPQTGRMIYTKRNFGELEIIWNPFYGRNVTAMFLEENKHREILQFYELLTERIGHNIMYEISQWPLEFTELHLLFNRLVNYNNLKQLLDVFTRNWNSSSPNSNSSFTSAASFTEKNNNRTRDPPPPLTPLPFDVTTTTTSNSRMINCSSSSHSSSDSSSSASSSSSVHITTNTTTTTTTTTLVTSSSSLPFPSCPLRTSSSSSSSSPPHPPFPFLRLFSRLPRRVYPRRVGPVPLHAPGSSPVSPDSYSPTQTAHKHEQHRLATNAQVVQAMGGFMGISPEGQLIKPNQQQQQSSSSLLQEGIEGWGGGGISGFSPPMVGMIGMSIFSVVDDVVNRGGSRDTIESVRRDLHVQQLHFLREIRFMHKIGEIPAWIVSRIYGQSGQLMMDKVWNTRELTPKSYIEKIEKGEAWGPFKKEAMRMMEEEGGEKYKKYASSSSSSSSWICDPWYGEMSVLSFRMSVVWNIFMWVLTPLLLLLGVCYFPFKCLCRLIVCLRKSSSTAIAAEYQKDVNAFKSKVPHLKAA